MKKLLLICFVLAAASTAMAQSLMAEDIPKNLNGYLNKTVATYGIVESVKKSIRTDGSTHEIMLAGGVLVAIKYQEYDLEVPRPGDALIVTGVVTRGVGFAKAEIKGRIRRTRARPSQITPGA
jgi:hypothetical protein